MPTATQINRIERDRNIIAMAKAGTFFGDIAAQHGLTLQRIWQICQVAGLQLPRRTEYRFGFVPNVAPKPPTQCAAGTKLCTQCGVAKVFSNFSKGSRESDGLQDNCKACNKAISAAYRATNAEKERQRHARYQAENPEKTAASSVRWRKNNPQKAKAISRRFYANNRDKERARMAKWSAENAQLKRELTARWRTANPERRRAYEREYVRLNKDLVNAKQARRRAQLMHAFVAWADPDKIKSFYTEAQRKTRSTGIEHHVDHVVPLVHSLVCGLHCEANLQVITGVENSKKHNSFSEVWEYIQVREIS